MPPDVRQVISAMGNAVLLSPADVGVIRRYVHAKYAALPGRERAEIVATAVRQTVNRRLPDLPADVKERIAGRLVRQCLVSERRAIEPEDVLDACASVALPDPAMEALILDPVLRWMQERAPGQWSGERLAARLFGQQLLQDGARETSFAVDLLPAGRELEETAELAGAALDKRRRISAAAIPKLAWAAAVVVLVGSIAATAYLSGKEEAILLEPASAPLPAIEFPVLQAPSTDIGMPDAMRYREIDTTAVKAYLNGRDSLLADEPYFSAIVDSARQHDVSPLLLFAITGQEQGFVPKSAKHAKQIANNPFNVFHSWEEFNTDIGHSADIAARTVSRQASKRPEGFDPFEWLNETYAEDPNWANGVKLIFDKLMSLQDLPYR